MCAQGGHGCASFQLKVLAARDWAHVLKSWVLSWIFCRLADDSRCAEEHELATRMHLPLPRARLLMIVWALLFAFACLLHPPACLGPQHVALLDFEAKGILFDWVRPLG